MNGAWMWYAPTTAPWSVLWCAPTSRGGLQSLARHTLVCPLERAAARPLARRAVVRAGGRAAFPACCFRASLVLGCSPGPRVCRRGPWRAVLWCAPGSGPRFRPVALVRPWVWAAAPAPGRALVRVGEGHGPGIPPVVPVHPWEWAVTPAWRAVARLSGWCAVRVLHCSVVTLPTACYTGR